MLRLLARLLPRVARIAVALAAVVPLPAVAHALATPPAARVAGRAAGREVVGTPDGVAARRPAKSARPPARPARVARPAAPARAKAAAAPQQRRTTARRTTSSRRRTAARPPARSAPRGRAARRARPAAAPTLPAVRYTTPRGAGALSSDLGYMLGSRTRGGQWGAMVVSLTRGDTLFSHNGDASLHPASTMKLFTAAIALDRLGPAHQFSTDVLRDAGIGADGAVQGNLYLRGDGDPGLSGRFLAGGPDAPMEMLARFVAGAGVKRVTGDLVADASGFEPRIIPDGWNPRNLGSGYAAPFAALSLNENVVWVAVHPDGRVALEPASTTIPIRPTVRVNRGSAGGQVSSYYDRDGAIVVRGWIGSRSLPRRYELVVKDPIPFTAGALRAALLRHGVTVDGQVRAGATPGSAVRVAGVPSQPLHRLVSVMNRESVNHFAELLYRNAARGPRRDVVGSAESSFALLRRFMTEKAGARPDAVTATDGSGLSELDRVTPRAMIQLLGYSHKAPWASAFHASLPVAGESELLRNRMKFTPAQGNLHAKTGTTDRTISLAGYVTAHNGEVLAFAFIYNGADRWNARSTIDVMGATMAGFVRE